MPLKPQKDDFKFWWDALKHEDTMAYARVAAFTAITVLLLMNPGDILADILRAGLGIIIALGWLFAGWKHRSISKALKGELLEYRPYEVIHEARRFTAIGVFDILEFGIPSFMIILWFCTLPGICFFK